MYCVRGRRRAVVTKVRPRLRLRQGVRGIGAPENDGVIRQQVADQDVRKRKDGYLALKPGCPPVCSGAEVWALSCSFVAPPANGCHRLPHRPGELSGRACAAVYSAARRSDGARSGYGRILSACEDQVESSVHHLPSGTGHTRDTHGRGATPFADGAFIGVRRTIYGADCSQKGSNTYQTVDSGVIPTCADTESRSSCA